MLDDSKHIIGVDADDLSKMILENIDNGSKIKFGGNIICFSEITSLIYNEDTRSLYSADSVGDNAAYGQVDPAQGVADAGQDPSRKRGL